MENLLLSVEDNPDDVLILCLAFEKAKLSARFEFLSDGESFTTVELKINFLRAVRQALLTAEAKVVKAGSTLGYVECEVKDEQGRLVAKAASTCIKLKKA